MFEINYSTMAIKMHRGDTGQFAVTAVKSSGEDWTANDRMIFTVVNGAQEVVLERYYRLDDGRTSVSLDNGVVLIELHNDDTDGWANGTYGTELRFVCDAVWDGAPETDDMVDATGDVSHIIEGIPVRTALQSTMTLSNIYGEV